MRTLRTLIHPRLLILGASLSLVVGLAGCSGDSRPATRAELRQRLEVASLIEVQVNEGGPDDRLMTRLVRSAAYAEERLQRRIRVHQGVDSEQATIPRIVVGTPGEPGIDDLLEELGVVEDGGLLKLGGLELEATSKSLWQLCAEDPHRPGLPLTLVVGRERDALLEVVENLRPSASPGVTQLLRRDPVRELAWKEVEGAKIFRVDFPQFAAFDGRDGMLLRFLADVPRQRVEAYLSKSEAALAHVQTWTGVEVDETLELLAVSRGEQLRALVGELDLAVHDGLRGRRAILLAADLPDDGGATVARWAAQRALGSPVDAWLLDAAAIDAADSWWGRPLEEWGRYLASGGHLPAVSELIDGTSVDRLSQHQLAPARALLLRHLRESGGVERLRDLWTQGDPRATLAAEDEAFGSWLGRVEKVGKRLIDPKRTLPAEQFLGGVALDSNMRLGGGLDGRGLLGSLQAAADSGFNSLSITSYFSEQPSLLGSFGGRIPLGRSSVEGDAAVAQAIAQARRAGIETVLLQPHLLLSDSTGYSAWLRRTSREHWAEFFDEFVPMLVHYGLLAELCGVDVLCLGTHLSTPSANGGLPEGVKQFYDQGWSRAIDGARRAFGGSLTYAANWPGEARHLRFWGELDLIGISLFPRFSELGAEAKSDGGVRKRFNSVLKGIDELAQEHGRPAMILEWGVRSTEQALNESALGTGPLSLEEQVRAFDAMAQALEADRAAGGKLAGLFLWKWTEEARGGGMRDRGFTPQNKPASKQLGRLVGKAANSAKERRRNRDEQD